MSYLTPRTQGEPRNLQGISDRLHMKRIAMAGIFVFGLFPGFVSAESEAISLICPAGRWEGSSVGFVDGEVDNSPNGISYPQFVMLLPPTPRLGDDVPMIFGPSPASPDESLQTIGTIGYISAPHHLTQFVTIHSWPIDAEETYSINLETGDVIFTSVKSGASYLWRDTFTKRCHFGF